MCVCEHSSGHRTLCCELQVETLFLHILRKDRGEERRGEEEERWGGAELEREQGGQVGVMVKTKANR